MLRRLLRASHRTFVAAVVIVVVVEAAVESLLRRVVVAAAAVVVADAVAGAVGGWRVSAAVDVVFVVVVERRELDLVEGGADRVELRVPLDIEPVAAQPV